MRITAAPPAMPAHTAMWPAWRPMTSTTITRWWEADVVWSRSMASVAICTAVSKPKVVSVALRSLSIVLGTPTTATPWSNRRWATPSVSSPPMATRASMPILASVAFTCSAPPSTLNGLVRDEPMMVPPWGSVARNASTSSGMEPPSITPRHPSKKPTISSPWARSPLRTTARITALSPGQSPPPVSMPTRIGSPQGCQSSTGSGLGGSGQLGRDGPSRA